MNIMQLREHPEYEKCMKKIKSYRKGFEFKIQWDEIPTAKRNALIIIMEDAQWFELVESVDFAVDLEGNITAEWFRRI